MIIRCGRPAVLVVLVALVLALAACTGVPSSSSPQVIKSLAVGGAGVPSPTVSPARGVLPRNLVQGFLEANALDANNRASARTFLTPAARSRWSDGTVTVVDEESVGNYVPTKPVVTVRGRVLGTVNGDGVYTPSLQGTTGPVVSFRYGIGREHGEYRISGPYAGLLLTQAQFLSEYQQRSVDFYDLAHRYLVPDPRWTSLTDPTQLIGWLMDQLAGGPVSALQNAVSNDTLPAQATARRITVTAGRGGTATRIDIPGSSQLDGEARNRLAAQLGAMIDEADRGAVLQITDGGRPLRVPAAGGTEFTGPEFTGDVDPPTPAAVVYYLRDGRVVDREGTRLKGGVDDGHYFLTSVAASRSAPSHALAFGGVCTIDGSPTLLVGTQSDGLRRTTVTGVTSRPAFAPGRDEVWVGDGERIRRVAVDGRTQTVSTVGLPSSGPRGRVVALRLSPEGSRIALAIQAPDGRSALYVGAIVRSSGLVRIDSLQQVSQAGADVTDVAWLESLKLFAIGFDSSTRDGRIFDVGVDGSVWMADGIGELPDPPSSISVTQGQQAWATSNSSVWVQSGGTSWRGPGPGSSTPGTEPVYLE